MQHAFKNLAAPFFIAVALLLAGSDAGAVQEQHRGQAPILAPKLAPKLTPELVTERSQVNQATEGLMVDPDYQLPDLEDQWLQFISELKDLKVRIDEIDRLVKDDDGRLGDRLKLDISEARMEQATAKDRLTFLATYQNDPKSWIRFRWENMGSWVPYHVLGWAMIQQADNAVKREGYVLMAQTYFERHDLYSAINIAKLGIDRKLANKALIRDYTMFLELATLRASDPVYNLQGATPSVCFSFARPLKSEQPLPLDDYIRTSTGQKLAGSIQGNNLCLNGLSYGDEMTVTLRRGLTAMNGAILAQASERAILIADRDPGARFNATKWIAPINGDETVAIHTINLDKAVLKLFRIGERGTRAAMNEGLFRASAEQYIANQLKNMLGESVWSGEVDIQSIANSEVTTLIPVRSMTDTLEPGLYVLQADWEVDDDQVSGFKWASNERPLQWLLFSDTGLTVIRGNDGLTVSARSLSSAKPRRNVSLSLIAENNEILGTTKTDRKGMATLDVGLLRGEGGNRPSHLIATADDYDYSLLRLGGDALDLSDFNISGRQPNKDGDLYLFTERPVYRAGETVFLTGFLRDLQAKAIANKKLTVKLLRPDQSEDQSINLAGDDLGGYGHPFKLNKDARTGRWTIRVYYTGSDTPLGFASFQVQDFVPLRLKSEITASDDIMAQGDDVRLTLQSDFLYGAPAAGLNSHINASLTVNRTPFKDYSAFAFGLVDDSFNGSHIFKHEDRLSETGSRSETFVINEIITTSVPLAVNVTATTFDIGGRPAYARLTIPFRHEDVTVGTRIDEISDRGVEKLASAEVVALDQRGEPVADRAVTVRWIKENYTWQWYQTDYRWQSKAIIQDEQVAEVKGITDTDGLLKLERALPSGAWRIEVSDNDGTSMASHRFHVGWWSWNRRANEPDQLTLKLDQTDLASGDTLRGNLEAPFDGEATIMVVSDRVHYVTTASVKEGIADFKIKTDKSWGTGAWLMATAFRPIGDNPAAESHLPVRATGFAWFNHGKAERTLSVEIDAPESMLPRQSVEIPVKITGIKSGEKARVTMLAVDEGILRLTPFNNPSLSNHYLSKRGLGVSVHDLYGRLMLSEIGTRGTVRSGGDRTEMRMAVSADRTADNKRGLTTRARRAVSLVSRDILVGDDGLAMVPMELPDFVGQLRLMAVVASVDQMGEDAEPLIVRDPIASDFILPRFMAPGDTAMPMISLTNLSGKAQNLSVALTAAGGVSAAVQGNPVITLKDGERADIPVLLAAKTIGVSDFTLTITGGTQPITRTWQMQVRPAYGYTTVSAGRMLEAAETLTLSPDGTLNDASMFAPGTSFSRAVISNAPNLNAGEMLENLRVYPYRCTEQTVSTALPMLLSDQLKAAGLSDDSTAAFNGSIDQAIARILMRQTTRGNFGLWRAYGYSNDWASLYAIDFLLRAKVRGFYVPDGAIARSIDWIRSFRPSDANHGLYSYSRYILATAGEANRGDVRHYASTATRKAAKPLADAHLGAALALVGETKLAKDRFNLALSTRYLYRPNPLYYDYGSPIRDRAATIALLAESGIADDLLYEAGEALETMVAEERYFNTQTRSWLIRAAAALSTGETLKLEIDGKPIADLKASWALDVAEPTTIQNLGEAVRLTETLRGSPKDAPAPMQNGATINRQYLSLVGKPIDPASIQQNDRFIVLITGQLERAGTEASLVLDMLPAGLEIENALVGGESQLTSYKFLPELTPPMYSSELDDRYFAVMDNRQPRKFAFAYMVRAITPGQYTMAPALIEDMYSPQYKAIGKAGTVTIAPAK